MSSKSSKQELLQELEVLEKIKHDVGRLFSEVVYPVWKLSPEDVRLVDEAGFGYTGIPIYGPELRTEIPHIDIAVLEEKYKGPKSPKDLHPVKITFPAPPIREDYIPIILQRMYGLGVYDLIKGKESFFDLPTNEADIPGVKILVPEPSAHVKYFATDTILNPLYTENEYDETKFLEWFMKLNMIRDVSKKLGRAKVEKAAVEMIEKSIERWQRKGWDWLR